MDMRPAAMSMTSRPDASLRFAILERIEGSPDPAGQRRSRAAASAGVGAVPPRWAGIHQVSSGPLGRTG